MIPGIYPIIGQGGISNVAFVNSVTDGSGSSATLMNGIEAGDLLVLVDFAFNEAGGGDTPTNVIPSGWTQIDTASDNNPPTRGTASYKIADGTEDGTTISGMNETAELKIILQYRANIPIGSVSFSSIVSTIVGGSNPLTQTLQASNGIPPVIGITTFVASGGGAFSPRTTSITPDQEISASESTFDAQAYLHSYIQEQSPQNYTWDMDEETEFTNMLMGFYIHNLQT